MFKSFLITSAVVAAALPGIAADRPASGSTTSATRLSEVTSTATSLGEERPVGPTGRPEWTSARRFSNVRVYIQKDPWQIGIEQWWRIHANHDDTIDHRLLTEIEIGLPYRMQLDIYGDFEGNEENKFHYQQTAFELRWAVADWGKIWGNPTLYAEYKIADEHWGPDVYELKLLLGGDLGPHWHWGTNFIWEAETGEEREQEFQVTGGLSYSFLEGKVGVGMEARYDRDTTRYHRGEPDDLFLLGPSIQFRPTERMHIDLSCLFGMNNVSQEQEAFIIIGYDFGKSDESHYKPVTGRQE